MKFHSTTFSPLFEICRLDIHIIHFTELDVKISRIAFPASGRKCSNNGELAANDVRQWIRSFQSGVAVLIDFEI